MKVIFSKTIFKVKTEDKEEANVIKFFQLYLMHKILLQQKFIFIQFDKNS